MLGPTCQAPVKDALALWILLLKPRIQRMLSRCPQFRSQWGSCMQISLVNVTQSTTVVSTVLDMVQHHTLFRWHAGLQRELYFPWTYLTQLSFHQNVLSFPGSAGTETLCSRYPADCAFGARAFTEDNTASHCRHRQVQPACTTM